ncbi:MAG: hypothetical protein V1733_02130 [bacterium]
MDKIGFCLVAMLMGAKAFGLGIDPVPGARVSAMGTSGVTGTDIWAVSSNQAGMAWLQGWRLGLYVENRFLVSELCFEAVALSWVGKPGAFGMLVTYSGFRLYNEVKAGVAYARKFGKRFSAGVQLNYYRIQIGEGYGSTGNVSCEVGLMYKPGQAWTLGVQVRNPVPATVSDYPVERMPVLFRLGIGYDLSGKAMFVLEGEKDLDNKPVIKSGVEIRLAKPFWGRLGVVSDPFMVTAGIGFSLGRLLVDLATGYHMILGFSPSISIGYSFGKL